MQQYNFVVVGVELFLSRMRCYEYIYVYMSPDLHILVKFYKIKDEYNKTLSWYYCATRINEAHKQNKTKIILMV